MRRERSVDGLLCEATGVAWPAGVTQTRADWSRRAKQPGVVRPLVQKRADEGTSRPVLGLTLGLGGLLGTGG